MPTLLEIGIDLYGDTSRFDATMDSIASRAVVSGGRAGSSFGSSFGVGFANPILNAVSGINAAIGGIQTIGAMALDVSGMRTNAEFNYYRRQLTGIAGDAKVAERAFKGFVDIANSTNFDTDQVMAMGLRKAGQTGDVAGALGFAQNTVDAAAAAGVDNARFDRFQKTLGFIESFGNRKVHLPQLQEITRYAPLLNTVAGRALGVSSDEAHARLSKMSGTELVALIGRIGEQNKGAAAKQAGSDPIAVGANIVDSLKSGLEPTGGLFNAVVTPAMIGIKTFADGLGQLNSGSGGLVGLVGVIGGGVLALRFFQGTVAGVTRSVGGVLPTIGNMTGSTVRATTALDLFTAALGRATGKLGTRGAGGGGLPGTPPPALSTALVPVGGGSTALVRIGETVAGAAGIAAITAGKLSGLARVFMFFGKTMGFLGKVAEVIKATPVGLIATAVSLGMSYLGSKLSDGGSVQKRGLGAMLSAAGTGLGIGALIGSFIGPEGTLIGGVIGGLVGAIGGAIQEKLRQNKEAADKASGKTEEAHTKAMQDHTEALKTTSKVMGGGPRATTSASIIEREWAVYALRGVG